jgi:SAM-dependent methyltransferase
LTRLERKYERYSRHHRSSRGEHFIYGGAERVHLFRRYVDGPSRRVLDLGCRYGTLSRTYLAGNEIVGVDVDNDALERAAELGIITVWADLDDPLSFEDASFDVVVAGELLEHLREPELMIAECRRVLCPGGTLVGSVPNGFRFKNRLRFLAGRHPESDPTHLHLFRPDDLRRLLSAFDRVELHFIASRFLRLHPRLFANDIVFAGWKPR